ARATPSPPALGLPPPLEGILIGAGGGAARLLGHGAAERIPRHHRAPERGPGAGGGRRCVQVTREAVWPGRARAPRTAAPARPPRRVWRTARTLGTARRGRHPPG